MTTPAGVVRAMQATQAMPAREYPARLLRVVDGDTLVVLVDLGLSVYTEARVRLRDAWCPELSAPGGREAQEATRLWCAQHADSYGWLRVRTFKAGQGERRSFIRYVADVEDLRTGEQLTAWLVAQGHAAATPDGVPGA